MIFKTLKQEEERMTINHPIIFDTVIKEVHMNTDQKRSFLKKCCEALQTWTTFKSIH